MVARTVCWAVRSNKVFLALIFACAAFSLIRPINQDDTWFWLAIGREVFTRGALPATEFYVIPALGEPAHFTGWGFSVVMYLVHQSFGLTGLAMLNAVCGALAMTLPAMAASLRALTPDVKFLWSAILALGLVLCLYFRITYRPEVLLYASLGAEIFLLERWLQRRDDRLLYPLPLLAGGLALAHPSVTILILVFGLYAIHYLTASGTPYRWRAAAKLSAVAAAMAFLALLNPYGLDQLTLPFQFALSSDIVVKENPEFASATEKGLAPFVSALMILGAIGIAGMKPPRLVYILLLVVFGTMAFQHARYLALLFIVLIVPILRGSEQFWNRLTAPFPPVLRIVATAALAVAAFLGATRLVSGLGPWGLNPRGDLFPFYAPEILRAAPLKVRIFNDFNFGGYLAWSLGPEPTIFMDGHFTRDTAALSQYLHVVRAKPGWEPILEFHDLNAIVIRPLNLVSGGLPPIVAAVANHPGWSLVHVDPAAVIYLRRDLVEKDPSLKRLPETDLWQGVERYAQALLDDAPSHTNARSALETARQRLQTLDQSPVPAEAVERRG